MGPVNSTEDEFAGIEDVPAPWTLNGHGLIVLMRSKADRLKADLRIPHTIRDQLKAPLSVLMYVNYTHSNAGPYQELLYIPGTAQFKNRRLPTISNIVVSSASSVKNGRINWGIPKQFCNFESSLGAGGSRQDIQLHQQGQAQFELAYTGKGFEFPITTGLIPGFLKTLGQHWQGQEFIYSPSARGKARFATLHTLNSLGEAFPETRLDEVKLAIEITRFEMTFPVPQILQAG